MVRIRIEISYNQGVEDPEASTLRHNLDILGFNDIDELKILKVYDLEFSQDIDTAMKSAKMIAENILINPVINNYKILILEEK